MKLELPFPVVLRASWTGGSVENNNLLATGSGLKGPWSSNLASDGKAAVLPGDIFFLGEGCDDDFDGVPITLGRAFLVRRFIVTVSGRAISSSGMSGGVGDDGERVYFRELVRDGGGGEVGGLDEMM